MGASEIRTGVSTEDSRKHRPGPDRDQLGGVVARNAGVRLGRVPTADRR